MQKCFCDSQCQFSKVEMSRTGLRHIKKKYFKFFGSNTCFYCLIGKIATVYTWQYLKHSKRQKYYCTTLRPEEHYVQLQTESVIFFADSLQTSFWLWIFDLTVVRITWKKQSTVSQMEISVLMWFSTGNTVLLIKKKKLLYHCLIWNMSPLPSLLFQKHHYYDLLSH